MKRTNIYTTDDGDDYNRNMGATSYSGNSYLPTVGERMDDRKNQWEQRSPGNGPTSYSAAVKGRGGQANSSYNRQDQGAVGKSNQGNWSNSSYSQYEGAAGKSNAYKGPKRNSVSFDDEKRHEIMPGLVIEGDVSDL